jgi:DNA-binding protein Alba
MIESTIDYKIEKFLITDEPVMKLVVDVLQVLNKIGKITIKGKGDLCPAAVSVSNIIIQNGGLKSEKISVSSETLDDGRLVSTIEIIITKIQS